MCKQITQRFHSNRCKMIRYKHTYNSDTYIFGWLPDLASFLAGLLTNLLWFWSSACLVLLMSKSPLTWRLLSDAHVAGWDWTCGELVPFVLCWSLWLQVMFIHSAAFLAHCKSLPFPTVRQLSDELPTLEIFLLNSCLLFVLSMIFVFIDIFPSGKGQDVFVLTPKATQVLPLTGVSNNPRAIGNIVSCLQALFTTQLSLVHADAILINVKFPKLKRASATLN